ncbi:heterokaryon incompatibility protein-domain-containing protein [Cladorrhinum samala]|uniref:Heterokaryon incompatibility protein-domain-containing protein n=1 Tax=Cladorrhinum samala TaxID=585594 RepID=A0AAV9HJI0_9PEZI|nr:heterokaryon incompatibility protein-domain-containing protein [Cladorrhinum samala]
MAVADKERSTTSSKDQPRNVLAYLYWAPSHGGLSCPAPVIPQHIFPFTAVPLDRCVMLINVATSAKRRKTEIPAFLSISFAPMTSHRLVNVMAGVGCGVLCSALLYSGRYRSGEVRMLSEQLSTHLVSPEPPPPRRYCGFCQFPLPNGAAKCDEITDKRYQTSPEDWRAMPDALLAHIRSSGLRGCNVCLTISNTLRQHYPDKPLSTLSLRWKAYGEAFDLSISNAYTPGDGMMYNSFRLLCSDVALTPSISPFVLEHPNPAGCNDAESHVRSLKHWMEDCTKNHEKCTISTSYYSLSAPLPTRMIKITDNGGGTHPKVKLVEFRERADYICLSHCWGGLQPDCITNRETYQRNAAEIPWSSLPRTFQDAVIITKLLGKEFLWIDSICIIQGDEDDWRAEAAKMCAVYENSFLTLMATSARDGHGGLFSSPARGQQHFISAQIQGVIDAPGRLFFRREGPGDFGELDTPRNTEIYPLLRRGWVFQERCLSLRIAHFTVNGVQYECAQGHKPSLRYNYGSDHPRSALHHKYGRGLWAAPSNATEFLSMWRGIVEIYSGFDLTYGSDRLPALAGLARKLASSSIVNGYQPGRYLAGAWQNTFSEALGWNREYNDKQSPTLCANVPTWSWASNSGRVTWDVGCELSLLDYQVQLKGPDEFGEVSSLKVLVSTRLLPVNQQGGSIQRNGNQRHPALPTDAVGDLKAQQS